jgi:hypothetical protein
MLITDELDRHDNGRREDDAVIVLFFLPRKREREIESCLLSKNEICAARSPNQRGKAATSLQHIIMAVRKRSESRLKR